MGTGLRKMIGTLLLIAAAGIAGAQGLVAAFEAPPVASTAQ
jgi:hypothetical protein